MGREQEERALEVIMMANDDAEHLYKRMKLLTTGCVGQRMLLNLFRSIVS